MNHAPEHLNALPQSTSISDFEIEQVLGHGGFGITYRGRDTKLGRTVAVKEYLPAGVAVRVADMTIHPKTRDDEEDYRKGLDDFLREAQVLARFEHHPNIVRVHRFFEAHGTAYIVMEYVEGQTLSTICKAEGTLDEPRLTAILHPLLAALSEMHAVEFLHRDIKPGNILLRDDGAPVMIDFGSARTAMAVRSQSMTSIVTPGFAPIEQYSTRGKQGPWTDIYAVGAVLYCAMTGTVPSDATSRIEDDDLVPVSQATGGRYGKPLCDAVDWALRLRGADRPQSIAEWREVLEGRSAPPAPSAGHPSADPVGGDSRSPAAPPAGQTASAPEAGRTSGGAGRRRWLAALGVGSALAALAAGGAYYYVEHGLPWKDTVSALLPMCREHAEGQAYAEAVECYGKVLKLNSVHVEAREKVPALKKAWVSALLPTCKEHETEGRDAKAVACYRKVRALKPGPAVEQDVIEKVKVLELVMAWEAAKAQKSVEGYLEFERDFPDSMFSGQSQCERKKLQGGVC